MAESSADVVVIGSGLAGASAAWHLARSGREVTLLERFHLGHSNGSSHGTSRIFRRAYADPFYVELTGRGEPWWDALESEAGVPLRTVTGGLDSGIKRDASRLLEVMRGCGVAAHMMAPEEVTERWPGLVVDEPAMFHPDAGWLNADATVAAMVNRAQAHGAQLVTGAVVESLEPAGEGLRVHSTTGISWRARHVVLCMGAWLPEQLPRFLRDLNLKPALPQFTVKQQEVFHFRQRDPGVQYPVVVHKGIAAHNDGEFYTLPSGADGGESPAMKIGQFDSAFTTTASGRDKVIDPRARHDVDHYLQEHFPGLEPEPTAAMSCLFTMTSDEDFLIDTVGPLTIASPCSGHGAKFAPLLGEIIAQAVGGVEPPERFRFRL
ncbi:FAD-dependent oxidoreductase [Nesterenkonia flava]|uniref:FAD-dependent oxidoreductase n=1 Tax=Nesterenkonia flava TaxID=469799 RepID=A0ABU1FVR0_9MICC|nr:FAD-dependent oxidoreductase [Nesterenkonia flava]MDR5712263.1 FAD-dependent oxidoreductase [Nesterenkonia flava]